MILIIKKFFSKSFLSFCIIGILNTIVHLIIYNLFLFIFSRYDNLSIYNSYKEVIANSIAFIFASIFSYLANAAYTYKKKVNHFSFWLSMLTFALKLLISDGLVVIIKSILIKLKLKQFLFLIPIPIAFILLPLQFLVFNKIFSYPYQKKN